MFGDGVVVITGAAFGWQFVVVLLICYYVDIVVFISLVDLWIWFALVVLFGLVSVLYC